MHDSRTAIIATPMSRLAAATIKTVRKKPLAIEKSIDIGVRVWGWAGWWRGPSIYGFFTGPNASLLPTKNSTDEETVL